MYTVKDLLESSENLQIRLIGKNLGGGVDREIKGIRIIEELDIKKYMVGGELLLTSLKVFEKMSEEMFLFHLEELNKKKISGFIIKRNESIPSYLLDTLFKFCEENHIPVLEISQNQNYFRIIKYILGQIYSKEAANRLYFVSMHDIFSGILLNESNLNVAIEKVLILLNKMLDNPVAIYSSDYDCYASSEEEPVSFNIENGLKRYIPEVITKQQYFIQKREYVEYINKMQLFDGRYFYLVITEKNNQLNDIDFAGMEDAILTLQFALMRLSAEEEMDIVKQHPLVGAEMTQRFPKGLTTEKLNQYSYEICRHHHERYDGTGYPDGLKGEDIPLSAQVVGLVDAYDALISVRPYKKKLEHDQAVQMILNGECGKFSDELLHCFKKVSSQNNWIKRSEREDV